ncbi:MAG: glycoside hydrolase family 97 protein [Alistipes sp.]|nr:glycoside hydrolase family 97 protein [Alistipes sp.]
MKRFYIFVLICALLSSCSAEGSYTLTSPDGKVVAEVNVGNGTTYSVAFDQKSILSPSAVAMRLEDGTMLGSGKVRRVSQYSKSETIVPQFYFKSTIEDNYNALKVEFADRSAIEFRAYNDGVAYRFITNRKQAFTVQNEVAAFDFAKPYNCWIAYNNLTGTKKDKYFTSFEHRYKYLPINQIDAARLAFTPVVVDVEGIKVVVAESDVENYPGMFISNADGDYILDGEFAPVPSEVVVGGHNKLQGIVNARHNYIAKCEGSRTFPWRILMIAQDEKQLAASDIVYRLASPSRVENTEWIAPGKVAWEWWNHWGLTDVDFEPGVNSATYKAYIDFAAEYGVEYVILDEGWATKYKNDLLDIVPEIDMEAILAYAESKGVGIILWAGYNAFNNDMERICEHYSKMGVKGFKIDFMDRDDQPMMEFYYRAAEVCAKHKLMVDFHGCAKPAGLNRTYPNVINFEAVFGLEQMKWSKPEVDMMEYDVTMPFIRMIAGPIDYTQGAMLNAIRSEYKPVRKRPMSQGTRCHQLAAYAVFFSPLSMLCDSPSNYRKNVECAEFIASVPTVWDETVVLDGKIGEYIVTARRSGEKWYVGGMTSWTPRTLEVDLSKLGIAAGATVELFCDGKNAAKDATDYIRKSIELPSNGVLTVELAPGGGFMMVL